MKDPDRQAAIKILESGEMLPPEMANILFPIQKRECHITYDGKLRQEDILADAMAVPLQAARLFGGNGEDGWRNQLIFGDNLQAMKSLLGMKERGQLCNTDGTPGARLVYIDPPFGTGDEYKAGDNAAAYSAKMQWGKFLEFLRHRLFLLRELLSDDGSIYIRMDYHFGHYIKVIADEVFGAKNFRNEIIINRFKRPKSGKKLNVSNDSLLVYSRTATVVFNEQKRSRICSFCGQETPPAWHDMFSPIAGKAKIIKERHMLPPFGQHWKYSQDNIDKMEAESRIRIDESRTYTDTEGNEIQGMPQFLQTEDVPLDTD